VFLALACAPAAAPERDAARAARPAASVATGNAQSEWDRIVAAAKQEGTIVVGGPPGEIYREGLAAFQQRYPEIRVEYSGLSGRDFAPKVLAERQAGHFLWDVHVGGSDTVYTQLVPAGAIDPIKELILRPEVMDDSKWLNGFDWGFVDNAGSRVFAFATYLSFPAFVNRDVVPEHEVARLEDLLDPKVRGKIVWNEPREAGSGAFQASALQVLLGADGLRKILSQQDVVVTKDLRQQVEWVTRGRYPIGIGLNTATLDEFQRLGVGFNVQPLDRPYAVIVTTGFGGCACAMNRPPHPNATRVYLDWLLSPEGQTAWNKTAGGNSRRLDVEPADPATLPRPGVEYKNLNRQEYQQLRLETVQIAKESLP
jgi:iron(III) transport system substrate-binding protein